MSRHAGIIDSNCLGHACRVGYACSCRAMRIWAASHPELFASIDVALSTLAQLRSFGSWAAHRREAIASISLIVESDYQMSQCVPYVRQLLQGELAGGQLRNLSLAYEGFNPCLGGTRVELGGWLSALPCLESLHVAAWQVGRAKSLS